MKIFLFLIVLIGIAAGIVGGCGMLEDFCGRSGVDQIPDRGYFVRAFIKQGSFSELKKSYTDHYRQVSDELKKIERMTAKDESEAREIKWKIECHEEYLGQMERALFKCPEHSNATPTTECAFCHGLGHIRGRDLYEERNN